MYTWKSFCFSFFFFELEPIVSCAWAVCDVSWLSNGVGEIEVENLRRKRKFW